MARRGERVSLQSSRPVEGLQTEREEIEMKFVKFVDENGDEHRIPTNQAVHVPSCGWVSENVAPSGSGKIELGLPTVVSEVKLADNLRLEVCLKKYPYGGVEIIDAQLVEECANGEYAVPFPVKDLVVEN